METFGPKHAWKSPSSRVLAAVSVASGAVSWALLWLWVPLAQIIAIVCGVVVLWRTRSNEEPSLLTACAGSGFMLGLAALVVAVVLHTAPDSFRVDE